MWGEYWLKVVVVRTKLSEVRTKTTEGLYSPVRLEQARLASNLLYGTWTKLATFEFAGIREQKHTAHDRLRGNGPFDKITTK